MSTETASEATIQTARGESLAAITGNVADISRGWVVWNGTFNGWVDFRINWNIINPNSTVIVTASEIDANGVRFIGAAPFTVTSIAPAAGFVVAKINIAWDSPLRIRTDLAVLN
ncbi:hypothetical protein [Streptomyces sp. YIM S03343]